MIIGNGSIAKLLNDKDGAMFFAAGLADSRAGCSDDRFIKHERERKVLFEQIEQSNQFEMMFVYFGTISKFYDRSFYIDHKRKMENMIRELAENYTIINLGNIWECTNPNTFINAYKAKPYKPLDEYKYMISKEQLNFITDNLPRTGKHEISIFGEMRKVKDCL
jgi:hypothetical protein